MNDPWPMTRVVVGEWGGGKIPDSHLLLGLPTSCMPAELGNNFWLCVLP